VVRADRHSGFALGALPEDGLVDATLEQLVQLSLSWLEELFNSPIDV
jgi:hypothetical protein